jgi:hypothetical protein
MSCSSIRMACRSSRSISSSRSRVTPAIPRCSRPQSARHCHPEVPTEYCQTGLAAHRLRRSGASPPPRHGRGRHRWRPTRNGRPGKPLGPRVGPVCPEVVRVAAPSGRADGPLVSQCTPRGSLRARRPAGWFLPSGGPSRVRPWRGVGTLRGWITQHEFASHRTGNQQAAGASSQGIAFPTGNRRRAFHGGPAHEA